jgi:hypothetical protein
MWGPIGLCIGPEGYHHSEKHYDDKTNQFDSDWGTGQNKVEHNKGKTCDHIATLNTEKVTLNTGKLRQGIRQVEATDVEDRVTGAQETSASRRVIMNLF